MIILVNCQTKSWAQLNSLLHPTKTCPWIRIRKQGSEEARRETKNATAFSLVKRIIY